MEKVRIQDDLYNNVNGEWLETAVIPDDKPTVGGFSDLATGVEKTLIEDLKTMSHESKTPNKYMDEAIKLFNAVMDTKKRNRKGAKPVLKTLKFISKIKDLKTLNRKLPQFVYNNLALPISIGVNEDMKDSNINRIYVSGPSTILPDAVYYKEGMEKTKEQLLAIWKSMTTEVMKLTKLSPEEQAQYIEDTLKFDALIAKYVKTREEWSEYTKIYNPVKTRRFNSLVKPLKTKKLLKTLYTELPEIIVIQEPRYFKNFKEVFNENTFTLYIHWAYVTELLGSTSLLSEKIRELGSTYRRAITGVAKISPVDKYAYGLVGRYFSEPLGLYYGEKYFGEEAKKDIVSMVKEIIETYKKRVMSNDFLEASTKEKAVLKLSTMKIKMGYPDKVDSFYDSLIIDETKSLYEICCELSKAYTLKNLKELNEKVDKTKWVMPGHMVNACYNPTSNDITFPAAILQAPFYSIKQSRSQNLGGIGAVIGHEISHAFDNNGAKVDENGNLNNWWTKTDNKKFVQKTKSMIKQFDGIELPSGKVNGKFIVSENIADNGGMAVTLEIMSNMKDANYEEYFINWAKVWCVKQRPEYEQLLLKTDVHAPHILRANMQPRNFEEWYKTFGATKKDKMYIAPNKRIIIW